jgi:flagellar hook protein FlgE
MSLFNTTQTGLQAIVQALQTSSDNLANAQTIGYKAETPIFETLLGNQIGSQTVGGGAAVVGIERNFSEGSLLQTGVGTNLAIEGDGFFIYQTASGQQLFSRNGQVTVGSDGSLVGPGGFQLMGFGVDAAGNPLGVLQPLMVPTAMIPPTASTKVGMQGNLDSSSPVLSGAINPSDPTTYSYASSVTVYDSLGNSHVVTFFFQNAGPDPANPGDELWKWMATVDGGTTGLTNNTGSFDFDSAGNLVLGGVPATPLGAALTNGAAPLSLSLDFTQLTQFGSASVVTGTADGNSAASPSSVSINSDGLVTVTFNNGMTRDVGIVALATFTSNQGLQLGQAGMFEYTASAGQATAAIPGAGASGKLRAGSLEESNVDTATELVNLVILQNAYGANAKALQVEDAMASTITNIQIR